MKLKSLANGRGEANAQSDVRDFVFAVDRCLHFATATDLFHKTHGPAEFICVCIQFIAVGDVFHFDKRLVQYTCGREFNTRVNREVFGILGVKRLCGRARFDRGFVHVIVFAGYDGSCFTVNSELFCDVELGAKIDRMREDCVVLNQVQNVYTVAKADLQSISEFQIIVHAEVTLVEISVFGSNHHVQLIRSLFPADFKSVMRVIAGKESTLRKVLVEVSTEVACAFRICFPVTELHIQTEIVPLVISVICICLILVGAAGVKVDLLVRGNCSLVPSLPELGGNLRVNAIIDRYLEHSRILIFANGVDLGHLDVGEEDGRYHQYKVFIGSADWMPRNLDHRIEVYSPVYDPAIKREARLIVEQGMRNHYRTFRSQEELYKHYKALENKNEK